jgi:hypothetical protein
MYPKLVTLQGTNPKQSLDFVLIHISILQELPRRKVEILSLCLGNVGFFCNSCESGHSIVEFLGRLPRFSKENFFIRVTLDRFDFGDCEVLRCLD